MTSNELFFHTEALPQPLSKEELTNMFIEMYNGNQAARTKIIEHNIRLVIYIVNTKYKFIDYDKQELVSIGLIGLVKAVKWFNIQKGNEFSTCATKYITNEIGTFLRKIKKYNNIQSLNDHINQSESQDGTSIEELLASSIDIEAEYIRKDYLEEHKLILLHLLTELSERDRKILMLYFGFYDDKEYTQCEIADILNLSQPYISRRIKKLLNILKSQFNNIEKSKDYQEQIKALETKSQDKAKTINPKSNKS